MELKDLIDIKGLPSCPIKDICLDSRKVANGTLFVALIGHSIDARCFIPQVLKQGVAAILSETEERENNLKWELKDNIPIIYIYDLAQKLSEITGHFYQHPTQQLSLVGITGTNGKTTIAQIIAQWLQLLGHTSAVMGTIGNGLYGKLQEANNTTGSALEVQQNLAQFVTEGAEYAVMEVSSHGLVQGRVEALEFSTAVFTNLSRDHLDYHRTMEEYAASKFRLFNELNVTSRIINSDDEYGQKWLEILPEAIAVSCDKDFSSSHRYIKAVEISYHSDGATVVIESSWGHAVLNSALIGPFNVSNLLLALATMLSLGFPLDKVVESVKYLTGVCGRMEAFRDYEKPTVIVDYAHTPDALQKALEAARIHCAGKLWCVFGCGGDRDNGKRPLMAKVAENFADEIIVTDDNPRTEDPREIIKQVMQGFSDSNNVTVIHQREIALEYAIGHAEAKDVVLIAGKGHETYQIIGHEKLHFSDREIVAELFGYSSET